MGDLRRVLVTGAAGFIGAHLLRTLRSKNLAVAALFRPETDTRRIHSLLPDVTQIVGDLRHAETIEGAVNDFAPDAIVHLAWYGVGSSHRNDPLQPVYNLQSTLALLHLAHKVGCRTWVGLGSQAEYGPRDEPADENSPTEPTTLYGTTKLCAYLLSRQLAGQFGIRFIWLRLFSAYGPMDNPGWMIPSLILSLLRGERPALTEGTQRWDYLFASDAAEAIYKVMTAPEAAGVFNLGSGEAHTIKSIAEQTRDLIDPSLPIGFGEVPFRDDQVMHLQADITRLRRAADWSPRVSLPEGLARTVEWYRDHREQFRA